MQVFGAPGSGVTTLATMLSSAITAPLIDLDNIHWRESDPPYVLERSPGEKRCLLQASIAAHGSDAVILAGSLSGWADDLRDAIEDGIWLLAPASVRIERIRERELRRFGPLVQAGGIMHIRHEAFLKWAADYDGNRNMHSRSLAADHEWFAGLTHRRLLLYSAQLAPSALLKQVLEEIKR